MISRNIGIAALATAALLAVSAPAGATSVGPRDEARFGDSQDRKQVREHDTVRKQQVRQNAGQPMYRPFFHPLYEGRNSAWAKWKRAFD